MLKACQVPLPVCAALEPVANIDYKVLQIICTSRLSFIKIRTVRGFIFCTPAMTAYKHAKPPILLYRRLKTKSCQIIVEEKIITFNGLPVSLDPSVMRVYGPSLICTSNSFMKCGASASLTIHEVLVLAHLFSLWWFSLFFKGPWGVGSSFLEIKIWSS